MRAPIYIYVMGLLAFDTSCGCVELRLPYDDEREETMMKICQARKRGAKGNTARETHTHTDTSVCYKRETKE